MQITTTEKEKIRAYYRSKGGYTKLTTAIGMAKEKEGKDGFSYDYVWAVINGERESEYIWNMAKKVMKLLQTMAQEEKEKMHLLMNDKY